MPRLKDSDYRTLFGKARRIRALRLKAGLNQGDLGYRCDPPIDQRVVSAVERGLYNDTILAMLAEALNYHGDPRELLDLVTLEIREDV